MATYAQVQALILGDMHRDDITAQVQTAMANAIDKVRMERLYFNETQLTFTATLTCDYLLSSALPNMLSIDTLRVWQNSTVSDVDRISWQELQGYDPALTTGRPHSWAVHHQLLRLYPTPNMTTTVEASGLLNLTIGAWCSYAPTLVRALAEVELYTLVTHDLPSAERAANFALYELDAQRRRAPTMASSGEVRPYL